MMKKCFVITIFLFALASNISLAQEKDSLNFPVDENSGKIKYQEVVEAEGKSVKLFYRAITWMNNHWDNARGMIKKQDKANGILKAHVRFDIKKYTEAGDLEERAGRLGYVLKMEFKDGRFRYTITDLQLLRKSKYPLERWIDPENTYYDQRDEEMLQIIADEIQEVIKSMKEGMKKEKEQKDDDW
ncbi:MAG: DUF4468 domain-containing protein [Bacteroidota bacterium]